jgi:hypothetical protein
MHNVQAGEHFHCLDMFRVASPPGAVKSFCNCAILLEIWDFGGLLQTSKAIPEQTIISIPSIAQGILAQVVSCEQDDFGFLIEISVRGPSWFPEGYTPPHILAAQADS